MKNLIFEVRNSPERITNKLDTAEEKISKLEGKTIENIQIAQRKKG